jgi:hypothetical protein
MSQGSSNPSPDDYWCFISYRHADNMTEGRQWASWLHHSIETYEVPEDLVGTINDRGDRIPDRIFPVFRDEDELPVDSDLATPIYRALDRSRFLLVLCSPRAVESAYVDSEITYFKKIGKSDRILASIIEGEPNSSWDKAKHSAGIGAAMECFPRSLMHPLDADGSPVESEQTEPIAADFRLPGSHQQGWTHPEAFRRHLIQKGEYTPKEISHAVARYRKQVDLAKLKIIAGILGIPLRKLTLRDKAYQLEIAKKRSRVVRRWLAAVAALAVVAVTGGMIAWKQRNLAKSESQRPYLAPIDTSLNASEFHADQIAFDDSGEWVAAARYSGEADATLTITSLSEPGVSLVLPSPFVDESFRAQFLDDGKILIRPFPRGGDESPRIWEYRSAFKSGQPPETFLTIASGEITAAPEDETEDSPETWRHGNKIASISDGLLIIRSIEGSPDVTVPIPHGIPEIGTVVFSKQSEFIFAVAVYDNEPRILGWSTADGTLRIDAEIQEYSDDPIEIENAEGWAISPMGDHFAAYSEKWLALGVIRAERAELVRVVRLVDEKGYFSGFEYSPDGMLLAVSQAAVVADLVEESVSHVYWSPSGETLGRTPRNITGRGAPGVRWSPNGRALVVSLSFDANSVETAWYAPSAPLFRRTKVSNGSAGLTPPTWKASYEEGITVDKSIPGKVSIRDGSRVIVTLHGNIENVVGWVATENHTNIYVIEELEDHETGNMVTRIGRWNMDDGTLIKRANLPIDFTIHNAALIKSKNQVIVSGQLQSWIGDSETLGTASMLEGSWCATSPGFQWHAVASMSRYDSTTIRLVSETLGTETIPINSGSRVVDRVGFSPNGRLLNVEFPIENGFERRTWELIDTSQPVPEWFDDFLFTCSFLDFDRGGRLNSDAGSKGIASPSIYWEIKHDKTSYGELARWFLGRGSPVTRWPGTSKTGSQLARKILQDPAPDLLRAYLLDPKSQDLSEALAKRAPNKITAQLRGK